MNFKYNCSKTCFFLIFTIFFLTVVFQFRCFADSPGKTFSASPILNGGEKWSIAYFEGGNYSEYHRSLNATIKGLVKAGWIGEIKTPVITDVTGEARWNYYSKNSESKYIELLSDGFYSAKWERKEKIRV